VSISESRRENVNGAVDTMSKNSPGFSFVLSDKMRGVLFWGTLALIVGVVFLALFTILRGCGGPVSKPEGEIPEIVVSPSEVSLCLGQGQQFVVNSDSAVWVASGGTIGDGGMYAPGDEVGDYIVEAQEEDSGRKAEAVVHIMVCTPTPLPTFTPAPTVMPTETPTPQPTVPLVEDAQGDVGTYESGAPVDGAPSGVDIRSANIGLDLSVSLQPGPDLSEALEGWPEEGEAVVWMTLWNPVPEKPDAYTEWLVALDLDGDTATGRPPGAGRINPDLGDEVAIGVGFDPSVGEYEPYVLVWNSDLGDWEDGPAAVRFTISESRTVVAFAVPMDVLTQIAGTDGVLQKARGRVAVLSYVGEQTVIDFFPDRP